MGLTWGWRQSGDRPLPSSEEEGQWERARGQEALHVCVDPDQLPFVLPDLVSLPRGAMEGRGEKGKLCPQMSGVPKNP